MDTEPTDMTETPEPTKAPETATPDVQDTPAVNEQPETDDINLDFWDKDQETEEQKATDTQSEETEETGQLEGFDLSECAGIPEDMHSDLADIARKNGLPGAPAAAMLSQAMELASKREAERYREGISELKRELGKNFDAEMEATGRYMARLTKKAGLTKEDCKILMSPNGYRLFMAMRRAAGESDTIRGGAQAAPKPSIEEQIDAIYNNEADYNALVNPMDTRHGEVNARMNKLVHALEESKRRR